MPTTKYYFNLQNSTVDEFYLHSNGNVFASRSIPVHGAEHNWTDNKLLKRHYDFNIYSDEFADYAKPEVIPAPVQTTVVAHYCTLCQQEATGLCFSQHPKCITTELLKQRLKATHFIEVWSDCFGRVDGSPMLEIAGLQDMLDITRSYSSLKTIAVWKIALKH